MTESPAALKIDQAALFEACNHDARLMAVMLAVTELVTGDRVEVKFAHAVTDSHVRHYRDELLKALGVDVPSE